MNVDPDAYVLLKVRHPDGQPSLAQVAEVLGIGRDRLDSDFGVVAIDPPGGEYVVRTRQRHVPHDLPDFSGPFSDPQIGSFGPPQ